MGIFLKNIQQFIDKTVTKEHAIVHDIAEEVIENLVELSPVDTGNFVSNWLLGIDKNTPWGVNGAKNPNKDDRIKKLVSQIPVDAANHDYSFVNNTRYAQFLEDGGDRTPGIPGSRQAPMGMVGLTKVRFPGIIRKVLTRHGVK